MAASPLQLAASKAGSPESQLQASSSKAKLVPWASFVHCGFQSCLPPTFHSPACGHDGSDPEDYVVAGVANLRRSLERQLDHPRGERLDLLLEEVDRLPSSARVFVDGLLALTI